MSVELDELSPFKRTVEEEVVVTAVVEVTVKAKVEPNCGVLSGKAVEEIVLDKCPPDTQVLAVKSVTQTRKTGRCA